MYKWKQVHLSDLEKDAQAKSQASPKEMSAEIDRLRKERRLFRFREEDDPT
jgi:hypothetical protein